VRRRRLATHLRGYAERAHRRQAHGVGRPGPRVALPRVVPEGVPGPEAHRAPAHLRRQPGRPRRLGARARARARAAGLRRPTRGQPPWRGAGARGARVAGKEQHAAHGMLGPGLASGAAGPAGPSGCRPAGQRWAGGPVRRPSCRGTPSVRRRARACQPAYTREVVSSRRSQSLLYG
jgi:hypothetical protein